jgi:hypothetical protein
MRTHIRAAAAAGVCAVVFGLAARGRAAAPAARARGGAGRAPPRG